MRTFAKILFVFCSICFFVLLSAVTVSESVPWVFPDDPRPDGHNPDGLLECYLDDRFFYPAIRCGDPDLEARWNAVLEPFFVIELMPLLLLSSFEDGPGAFAKSLFSLPGILVATGFLAAVAYLPWTLVRFLRRRHAALLDNLFGGFLRIRGFFFVLSGICFLVITASLLIKKDVYPRVFESYRTGDEVGCYWETVYMPRPFSLPIGKEMICYTDFESFSKEDAQTWQMFLNLPNAVLGIKPPRFIWESSSWRHPIVVPGLILDMLSLGGVLFVFWAPARALRYFVRAPGKIRKTPFFFFYLAVFLVIGRVWLHQDLYSAEVLVMLLSLSCLLAIGSAELREKWRARKLATTPEADTPGTPPAALPPPAL